ncbi:hypothetical protein CA54_59830 [Symmachiella macrocystis]|uniref:Uncharacterized protein n=1 Tax=Symmachiella macrocystis TaxID=2527985 RepID=A0A5C6AZ31_9PLAN|nr:hypothetical protein [Symmachiella macrocystis]TWU05295.1 hypothetical protein CA54_59830 [Symmachiella macrocystis]
MLMRNVSERGVARPANLWVVSTLVCSLIAVVNLGCSQEAGDALDKAGEAVSDAAEETGGVVKDAAEDAGEAVGDATESAGELAKEAGDKLSAGFSAAADKAASALEGVDGGSEVLTQIKGFFSSAQETLKGITNKESAEAAVSKLGDLDGAAAKISDMVGKLPESAQTSIGPMIAAGIAQLKALIEKIEAIPGVSDVIQPKLTAFMDKMKSMSGQ